MKTAKKTAHEIGSTETRPAGCQRPDRPDGSRARISRSRARVVPAEPAARMGNMPDYGKRMSAYPQQARISVSRPDIGARAGHTGPVGWGGRSSFLARFGQRSGSEPVRSGRSGSEECDGPLPAATRRRV